MSEYKTNEAEIHELALRLSRSLRERGEFIERITKGVVGEVTSSNIDKVLNENDVVFLYFTAEWCGPCITFLETFKDVASMYVKPKAYFGKVDVDVAYSVADRYNVRHIPSILVIVKGKLVDVVVGSQSREKLEEKVKSYIEAVKLST